MKIPIPSILLIAGSALVIASCAVPNSQPMQPGVDVEEIERQAPVTPTPNVGQHEAARNAVDYSNPRSGRYGDGYGSGYGGGYRRY